MKQNLKPLSSRPPVRDENKIKEFIDSANDVSKSGSYNLSNSTSSTEENSIQTYKKVTFPWQDPNVRDDLKKTFLLRFSEKDFVKLEYLAKLKKESKHSICMSILINEINKLLNIDR